MALGDVVLHDPEQRQWLAFHDPIEIVKTNEIGAVFPALRRVEGAVEHDGLYAAGFLSYEAAPAFDSAFTVLDPDPGLPLLWFGLYREPAVCAPPGAGSAGYALGPWEPSADWPAYERAFARVYGAIAAGETYQVNLTYRLRARWSGDAWPLFVNLAGAQGGGGYAAWVDTGRHALCSASPELCFRRAGEAIATRPMKGTAPRGRTAAEDEANARWLARSEKDRAENVMIADMIRNDLGRIAEPGSVRVPKLFTVERYPTVLQLTSTVTARSGAPLSGVFGALFPCASITGAPKVSTMRLIASIETAPRGVYTGCIGYAAPGQRAQFNVAIRTVTVDREAGTAEYGVGGGVVADSTAEAEYRECALKAEVLSARTTAPVGQARRSAQPAGV